MPEQPRVWRPAAVVALSTALIVAGGIYFVRSGDHPLGRITTELLPAIPIDYQFGTPSDGIVVATPTPCAVHGAFLRTTNSGRTWERLASPSTRCFRFHSLRFFDQRHGVVRGDAEERHFYRTSDGGQHWSDVELPAVPQPMSQAGRPSGYLAWADYAHVWWLDSDGGNPVLHRSTDAGDHWQTLLTAVTNQPAGSSTRLPSQLLTLSFADPKRGWLSGAGFGVPPTVYDTSDGGLTWRPTRLPPPPEGWATGEAPDRLMTPPTVLPTGRGAVVALVSRKPSPWTTFAATSSTYPVIYSTVDGGVTWKPIALPEGFYPQPSNLLGDGTWWAIDKAGQPRLSRDGGASWNELPALVPGGSRLVRLTSVDASHAVAIGLLPQGAEPSLVFTSDSGEHWHRMKLPRV
jgi:photosystem II stability/assembly factor-like uncharacterized protein